MKIYEEQIEALESSQAQIFEGRAVDFIVTRLSGGSTREVSRDEIRRLITEAHDSGLETERQVMAYVVGAWAYADDFLAIVEPMRDRFRDERVEPATITRELLGAIAHLSQR